MLMYLFWKLRSIRSSHQEVCLGKGVLKICSKFTGEHPCRSVISINLQSNFIEITFRYRCSPVNFLHNFRTPFLKNSSRWLLLKYAWSRLSKLMYLEADFQYWCIHFETLKNTWSTLSKFMNLFANSEVCLK